MRLVVWHRSGSGGWSLLPTQFSIPRQWGLSGPSCNHGTGPKDGRVCDGREPGSHQPSHDPWPILQLSPAEGKAVQEDKVGAYCPDGIDVRLECGRRRRRISATTTPTPRAKSIARAANLPPGQSRRRDHTGVDSPDRARRKATTLSPIEVPASECPPAAMTTYCSPFHR